MQTSVLAASLLLSLCALPAWAAHPLSTEDTGVQGSGNWQLELNSDRVTQREQGSADLGANATLTRGIGETLDLAVNLPWLRNTNDPGTRRGIGDMSLFAKWRIFEHDALSAALKPVLFLPTGRAGKGLGSDRAQAGLTAILMRESGDLSTMANLGYLYADNAIGDRKDIWSASGAIQVGLASRVRLVAEAGGNTDSAPRVHKYPLFANAGLIYSANDQLDVDIGYRRGLNDAEAQYAAGVGITVRW